MLGIDQRVRRLHIAPDRFPGGLGVAEPVPARVEQPRAQLRVGRVEPELTDRHRTSFVHVARNDRASARFLPHRAEGLVRLACPQRHPTQMGEQGPCPRNLAVAIPPRSPRLFQGRRRRRRCIPASCLPSTLLRRGAPSTLRHWWRTETSRRSQGTPARFRTASSCAYGFARIRAARYRCRMWLASHRARLPRGRQPAHRRLRAGR